MEGHDYYRIYVKQGQHRQERIERWNASHSVSAAETRQGKQDQSVGNAVDQRLFPIKSTSYYIVEESKSNPYDIQSISRPINKSETADMLFRHRHSAEFTNEQSRITVEYGRNLLAKFETYRSIPLTREEITHEKHGVQINPDKFYIVKGSDFENDPRTFMVESISQPFSTPQTAHEILAKKYPPENAYSETSYSVESGHELLGNSKWNLLNIEPHSQAQQQAHSEQHSQSQQQPQAPQTGKAIASAVEQEAGYGFGM
ncbi:MAG: hypothetical protein FWD64_01455 [Acidobacteriaceae bacterium]|nr:hypothetical protein [Acidobacteriaceae bacterium]